MYIEVFMSKKTKYGSWSVIFHVLFRLVLKYKMAAVDFLIFLKFNQSLQMSDLDTWVVGFRHCELDTKQPNAKPLNKRQLCFPSSPQKCLVLNNDAVLWNGLNRAYFRVSARLKCHF